MEAPLPPFSRISKELPGTAQESLSLRTSDPGMEAYSFLSQWDGTLKPPKLNNKHRFSGQLLNL